MFSLHKDFDLLYQGLNIAQIFLLYLFFSFRAVKNDLFLHLEVALHFLGQISSHVIRLTGLYEFINEADI